MDYRASGAISKSFLVFSIVPADGRVLRVRLSEQIFSRCITGSIRDIAYPRYLPRSK